MVCGKVCKPPAGKSPSPAGSQSLASSSPAAGTSLGFAPSLGPGAEAVSLAVTPGLTPSLSPTLSPGATPVDRRVAAFARRHRKSLTARPRRR